MRSPPSPPLFHASTDETTTAGPASDPSSGGRRTIASRVSACGSALHASARSLETEDPAFARILHRAADRVEGFAGHLTESGVREARRNAESFARRHPAAFFGGLFAAGLIVGTLAKASARKIDPSDGGFVAGEIPDSHSSDES